MIGHLPSLPCLTPELVADIVERIVAVTAPDKIVLFGSRAQETYRADSDIDLLVVKASEEPSYKRSRPIYAALADLPTEVDIDVLVYTPEEVQEWSEASAAFVTTALRQGKVIYERQR